MAKGPGYGWLFSTVPNTATLSNPIGRYSKPSEAYAVVSKHTFSNGIYIQLQNNIEEDSLSFTTSNENTTIDLNKHNWSKATPSSDNTNRIILPTITPGHTVNVINGTLRDNTLNIAKHYLGAAIYASNASSGNIKNWLDGNKDNWGTVNIFDVDFSNNYAEGGGAICINGAVELNVYDSTFDKNKSLSRKQTGNKAETGSGSAIYVWRSESKGEIVNLYDCTFTGNDGDGMLSVESGNTDVLFNIYGGAFTGNRLYEAPLMSICSFNIYGGNFSDGELSNDSGNSYPISINGGIIDTLEINGSNELKLNGGSVGFRTGNHSDDSSKELVSATLPNAAKVEYIEYLIDGGTGPNYVNINSPFNITESGVVYSYDDKFDSSEENVFNNSEYNPAIKEFNVFLPSSEVDSIENITVHLAGGDTIELTKVADSNPVRFEK